MTPIPDPASLSTVMDLDAGIVTMAGFPYGVVCGACDAVIPEGEAYISRDTICRHNDPQCAHGDIVCAACGMGAA